MCLQSQKKRRESTLFARASVRHVRIASASALFGRILADFRRPKRVRRDTSAARPLWLPLSHAALRVPLERRMQHPRRPAPGRFSPARPRHRREAASRVRLEGTDSPWTPLNPRTPDTRRWQPWASRSGAGRGRRARRTERRSPNEGDRGRRRRHRGHDGRGRAAPQSENNSLRVEVAELKRSLEDAEQRARRASTPTDYKKARRTNMKCARRTTAGSAKVCIGGSA